MGSGSKLGWESLGTYPYCWFCHQRASDGDDEKSPCEFRAQHVPSCMCSMFIG